MPLKNTFEGGGGDSNGVDSSDFVDTDSLTIHWGRIAQFFVGSVMLAYILGVIETLQTILLGVRDYLVLVFDQYLGVLIGRTFAIPTRAVEASWDAAADFVEIFGAGAFPIAVVLTAVTVVLLNMGVNAIVK